MKITEYKNNEIIKTNKTQAHTRKVLFEKFNIYIAGEEFFISKMEGCLIKTRYDSLGTFQRTVYFLDSSGLIQFSFMSWDYLVIRKSNWDFYKINLKLSNEGIQELIRIILLKNMISDKHIYIRESDCVHLSETEKYIKENGNF